MPPQCLAVRLYGDQKCGELMAQAEMFCSINALSHNGTNYRKGRTLENPSRCQNDTVEEQNEVLAFRSPPLYPERWAEVGSPEFLPTTLRRAAMLVDNVGAATIDLSGPQLAFQVRCFGPLSTDRGPWARQSNCASSGEPSITAVKSCCD